MLRPGLIFGLTTLLFAAGCILFFTEAELPCKVAWPACVLAVSVWLLRRGELFPIGLALAFSALGDAAGARNVFMLQMLFFALAHAAYMGYFLPRAKEPSGYVAVLLPIGLFLFLFLRILPEVSVAAERVGAGIYGLVIGGMVYSVFRYRGRGAAGFRCAALLFVFSDTAIAWSRFVAPIPGRTFVVMISYYAAQFLFWFSACRPILSRSVGNDRT